MPSSNKSVGSASSNPKKQKKASRKKDKKEKQQQQKEPAQPKAKAKASSSSPIRSRRAHHSRRASLPPKVEAARNLVLMLVVVVLGLGLGLLCALVGYRAMHGRGSGSNRLRTFTMKRRLLPVSRLVHNVERIASRVLESPLLSAEASATRLRRRALQEMRLNNVPLQDVIPARPSNPFMPRDAVDNATLAKRDQHKAALQQVQPLVLNGREQDCVSARCLLDGSFPHFRRVQQAQRAYKEERRIAHRDLVGPRMLM